MSTRFNGGWQAKMPSLKIAPALTGVAKQETPSIAMVSVQLGVTQRIAITVVSSARFNMESRNEKQLRLYPAPSVNFQKKLSPLTTRTAPGSPMIEIRNAITPQSYD
jgi:hypothetical protein